MKKLIALISSIVIVFSLLSGFAVEPVAECKHVLTGDVLAEIVHPHKEFMRCSLCSAKVYTGNNRALPHGPTVVYNSTPPSIFTLDQKPAYTQTYAFFWLDESVSSVTIPITTYFDYS